MVQGTVALVLPATEERRSSAISQAGAEHLGLGYLAAYLRRQGAEVRLFNFQVDAYLSYWELAQRGNLLSPIQWTERILEVDPDVVGMSITGVTIKEALELARALKAQRPRLHITWGGHQAYFSAREILEREEAVDSVVAGDGEVTLARLVEAVKTGGDLTAIPGLYLRAGDRVINTGPPPEPLLDELPSPDRDTLDEMLRRGAQVTDARVSTSRGCPFHCTFCVDPSLGYRIKWRARSAEKVVEEMLELVERYGISFFWFSEDNFIPPNARGRARAATIADLLIAADLDIGYRALLRADAIHGQPELLRKLMQSGLSSVYIGVESGSPRRLEYFKKNETTEVYRSVIRDLNAARVGLQIGFIMFDPLTSWEDLLLDAHFLHEVGQMYLYSNFCQVLDVFPGTEMSQMLIARGLLDPGFTYDSPYDEYDYEIPEIGELGRACQAAYSEEMVTLDKFFQRLAVVDLPGLWRLQGKGALQGVEAVQQVADRGLERLNDAGLQFFLAALETARDGWSEEAFLGLRDAHLRNATQVQDEVIHELRKLPEPIVQRLTSLTGVDTAAGGTLAACG